ncbi:hypothetical protein SynBIOSE41_02810 [Synechococcus sp. BIOS-E4-1]|nr:hypothetical protein SynBIOSE41_02810 [Synechococcus sp. BIOS-E4-1]
MAMGLLCFKISEALPLRQRKEGGTADVRLLRHQSAIVGGLVPLDAHIIFRSTSEQMTGLTDLCDCGYRLNAAGSSTQQPALLRSAIWDHSA